MASREQGGTRGGDMEEHEKTVALVNWENVTPVTLGLLLLTIM